MDQHLINIIVALIIAGAGAMMKKPAKSKEADPAQTDRATSTTAAEPPVMTEADRRYREVQEEIRRRIAQRNQRAPTQPATVTPNPATDYRPSKQITTPIGRKVERPLSTARTPKAAPPPTLTATTMKMDAIPMMANAPIAPAMPAYPSEAAAYALPKDSGDNAASSSASPGGSNALRAILASPSAARQAFLLREIFATPLGLRPLASGGHEDWN
jgi:hypothetical protein